MPDRNAAKRPHPETPIVLDTRTPGATAQSFLAATWPRPRYYFTHAQDEFFVSNDGRVWSGVPLVDLQAKIWRFLESAVDKRGDPIHPTRRKVAEIVFALRCQCRDSTAGLHGSQRA
jgi:hypothetical protein